MRKESRAAKGAEADSTAGVQQLESRLAHLAVDHKQDVRRMGDTIEARHTAPFNATNGVSYPVQLRWGGMMDLFRMVRSMYFS